MKSCAFLSLLLVGFFVSCFMQLVCGVEQQKLCAACHVIVDEIEYQISTVDPRKTLQVQGFRVDPTGNQQNKKVKYARSETHLTEVTESLCEKMNQYGVSTNKDGSVKYVLTAPRNGEEITLENVSMGSDAAEKLKHICNSIIEENEENIIDHFKKPSTDSKKVFCADVAELCQSDDDGDEEEESDGESEGEKDELWSF